MKTFAILFCVFLTISSIESAPKLSRNLKNRVMTNGRRSNTGLTMSSSNPYPTSIATQSALTTDQISCLAQQYGMNGHFLLTTRVYDPDGQVDQAGIQNVVNSAKSGKAVATSYMAPCADGNCKNNIIDAASQVNTLISAMMDIGSDTFIWVAVQEGKWSQNQVQNQKFLEELLTTIYTVNEFNGIMSSKSAWTKAFGANYTIPPSVPLYGGGDGSAFLWWVYWNSKQDFSDFTPFGNFQSTSNIWGHQYAGHVTTEPCAPGVPLDFTVFIKK